VVALVEEASAEAAQKLEVQEEVGAVVVEKGERVESAETVQNG
jgi:hypothetical protein